jgi:two-component system response regulator DevR
VAEGGKEAALITVFLVDDHEGVRRAVADLLDADPGLTVVGDAPNAAEALVRIPALRPDVALLDVRLPDGNGVDLCRELRARLPELNVLMLTSYTDEEAMLTAILAGAAGYVIKDIQGLRLVAAVHAVGSGRSLLDNRAAAMLMSQLRAGLPPSLTEHERTLLDLIGEGLTNRQIAARMVLPEMTVKTSFAQLLTKLGPGRHTQAEARWPLVSPDDKAPDGGERPLLDEFAPNRDFALTEHLVVGAPPDATYAAVAPLRDENLRSRALRSLTWARGLPVRARPHETAPAFEEILVRGKWVLLGERPGREIVLGAAGRFWTPFLKWHDITPEEFATYGRPRSGTIALAFSVRPYEREQSLLTFGTRITVLDPVARRWAQSYWRAIRPSAALVARQILHAVNEEATGRRPSVRN